MEQLIDHDSELTFPANLTSNVPENIHGMASVLTEAQVLLGYQVDTGSLSVYKESDPISQMLRNLEQSVINEKDEEISVLKIGLKEKNKEIVEIKENLTKLVDYITFVHGQFGKLLMGIMVMEIKDGTNVLRLGPFKDETTKIEFVQNLNGLSTNFLSDYENLKKTRELFDKVNSILSSRDDVKTEQSESISNGNTNHSNVQFTTGQINAGVNYASSSSSSFTQAIPLHPPPNFTRQRNSLTEYSVLSIPEAVPPNVMEPAQLTSLIRTAMQPPLSPANLTMRRAPPSISRNSLQIDYGINLSTANKKHEIDHSKGHFGFFCLCNTRFSNSGTLKDHIQYFNKMRNFECIICKKRYHNSSLLKLHMISSHKLECLRGGVLTCSICHGNFSNWKEFRVHLQNFRGIEKRHTSIQPNKITNGSLKHAPADKLTEFPQVHGCICGKKYSHKNALSSHIRTQLHGKVFKCRWCNEKFHYHLQLKKHTIRTHGMEQNLQYQRGCGLCGETFPTTAEFKKHRNDVHLRKISKGV